MRAKTLVVTTICLVVSALGLSAVSHAKKGGSGSTVHTGVEAQLTPVCGNEPDAEGEARRDTNKLGSVVLRDRLKANVKIPLPSSLGIMADTAATADIRLKLNLPPATSSCPILNSFAECRLVLEDIEMEEEDGEVETEAEYEVHVRARNGSTKAIVGTCDLDPTTAAIDLGVPAVEVGDVATATLVDPSESAAAPNARTLDNDFLQGTFAAD